MRRAVFEFLSGSFAANPYRVGRLLQRELDGLHSAKRGEYRVVYEIRDDDHTIVVHRLQHRRDAYRPR